MDDRDDPPSAVDNPAAAPAAPLPPAPGAEEGIEFDERGHGSADVASTGDVPTSRAPGSAPASTTQSYDSATTVAGRFCLRETEQLAYAGFPMLLPLGSPRFLVYADALAKQLVRFDMARGAPGGRLGGIVVFQFAGNTSPGYTTAVSADGASLCVSQTVGGAGYLLVFDTAQLLAAGAVVDDPAQSPLQPRAQTAEPIGEKARVSGAAFSADGNRLFAMCTAGAVTVHDARHIDLPRLRTLPFKAGDWIMGNYLLASTTGLLAAVGGGYNSARTDAAARQVRVWWVGNEANQETELHTLDLESVADSVAIRPDGRQFAVGLRIGSIKVFSPAVAGGGEAELVVELDVPTAGGDGADLAVNSLCFGPDGAMLAAGRQDGTFMVYEMAAAAAVVNVFAQPKSDGFSLAFVGHASLVTGGGYPGKFFVRSLAPPNPHTFMMSPEIDIDDGTIMSAAASISNAHVVADANHGVGLVALASGSHLEVRTFGGEVLLATNLGAEISLSIQIRCAVRLQPSGAGHVACAVSNGKQTVVLSVADGTEAARLSPKPSMAMGLFWSPDGSLLVLTTGRGFHVYAAEHSFAEVQLLQDDANISGGVSFDRAGSRLAAGTSSGAVTVWDVATWAQLHVLHAEEYIYSVCLSATGDRVAYATRTGQVVVQSVDATNVVHLRISPANGWADLSFSPDGDFMLVCPSEAGKLDQHKMRVLDLKTGADAEWGAALRTMALPTGGGMLQGRSVGWVELLLDNSADDAQPAASSWMLYGAVGSQFVVAGIETARDAIEDAAWSVEQLALISEQYPEQAAAVASAAPHCVNIRDPATEETLLHHLARTRQVEPLQIWLGNGAMITPVADAQRRTAVTVALEMEQIDIARSLWRGLVRPLNIISASLVLNELRLLTRSHPHLVEVYLQEVEPAIVKTMATFRTELFRPAEVVGWSTTSPDEEKIDMTGPFEHVRATSNVPAAWADILPSTNQKQLVESKVVLLPDLLADSDSSPFHAIVQYCKASVFRSKLLELIVQSKWEENVQSQRYWSFFVYGACFVEGAAGMVMSANRGRAHVVVDVLQGVMMCTEAVTLGMESFQLKREGLFYFTGPWNLLDIAASVCLLAGGVCHFRDVLGGVQTMGALGVALKCFGLVDYLRSFPRTASLVRMVSVILTDIVPFTAILIVMVFGASLFFAINSPTSEKFALDDETVGPFRPLLTVFQLMLGMEVGMELNESGGPVVLMVMLFMVVVVVVLMNLLIAIMADSYEKVKESERVEALRERAQLIVQAERTYPSLHKYHRYMHFVEAADSSEPKPQEEWEGITGRVKQLLEEQDRRAEQKIKAEMQNLETKMKEMMKTDMRQIKDLLLNSTASNAK